MYGQLGIGTGGDPRAFASGTPIPPTYADEHTPVQVGKDRDWATVSAGSWRTVAIKTDGTLWAWGIHGIASPGVDGIQVRPLRLSRDTDWASVSLGKDHAAALKKDGTLWLWGDNGSGQLGIGIDPVPGRPNTTGRGLPAQVGTDRDWAVVSVGTHHTAALKADGTLWTWGLNYHGQLGDGTLPDGDGARYFPFRNAPTAVSLAPDNGAESRPGAPKMVRLYPRGRTNDVPAILGGESSVPFIEKGRTLVPLRFLGEQLGAVVRFDSAKKEVTITKGTITIQLRLGEKAAHISQEGA
ncbi:MAG: stalk domain-containing protein, partial [Firmicutes bacterium]|nr:stalk domain-containing protein [Bacillota bacterium]